MHNQLQRARETQVTFGVDGVTEAVEGRRGGRGEGAGEAHLPRGKTDWRRATPGAVHQLINSSCLPISSSV